MLFPLVLCQKGFGLTSLNKVFQQSVHRHAEVGNPAPLFAIVPAMPKINGLRILTCPTEIILD